MNNEKRITREMLDTLSIFELRIVARQKGVSSPTIGKKMDLIEKIMAIEEGAVQPVQLSKRGRPPKPSVTFDVAMVVGGEITESLHCDPPAFGVGDYQEESESEENNEKMQETTLVDEKEEINQAVEKKEKEPPQEPRDGVLEIMPDGYGFLRAKNCDSGNKDTYIAAKLIRQFNLRKGDYIQGIARVNDGNRPAGITIIGKVNGISLEEFKKRPMFDNLVPIFPDKKLKLELEGNRSDFSIRCLDLVAPIGKGQRAMIVSPPKAGKTTLLKKIAKSITINYPDVKVYVLLVDERPEEVTDMKRSINAEVIYSTFDEMPEHHVKTAELLLERAKREVEGGKDVVIILDSLTRLARAYNLTIPPTGRTLSGGIDPGALHSPKRFFGAARNIEHGGSLTVIATALVDTGSRMDDIIYEEFKGTGNMEVHLDRKLSEKRIFPAIDLNKSSTRREDLLLTPQELDGVWAMRKMLSNGETQEITEKLLDMLIKTKDNKEFVEQLNLQMKLMEKSGYRAPQMSRSNNNNNRQF